jgi:hypothetical protein
LAIIESTGFPESWRPIAACGLRHGGAYERGRDARGIKRRDIKRTFCDRHHKVPGRPQASCVGKNEGVHHEIPGSEIFGGRGGLTHGNDMGQGQKHRK